MKVQDFLAALIGSVIVLFLGAWITQTAFNYITGGFMHLTYSKAMALYILCGILFKSSKGEK